jgi:hypothetical protein
VCYGCTEAFGDRGYRLIEDPQRFPKLLDCVDEYRKESRPFRRCYRGLLHGYFSFDPDHENTRPSGKRNWEILRVYLHARLNNITAPGINPEWVIGIQKHCNLLTEDPCRPYGMNALQGRGDSGGHLRSKAGGRRRKPWPSGSSDMAQTVANPLGEAPSPKMASKSELEGGMLP